MRCVISFVLCGMTMDQVDILSYAFQALFGMALALRFMLQMNLKQIKVLYILFSIQNKNKIPKEMNFNLFTDQA